MPSIPAKTAEPGLGAPRSDRNSAEGLRTCANPLPVISNTPISSAGGPKRFFTARRMRN